MHATILRHNPPPQSTSLRSIYAWDRCSQLYRQGLSSVSSVTSNLGHTHLTQSQGHFFKGGRWINEFFLFRFKSKSISRLKSGVTFNCCRDNTLATHLYINLVPPEATWPIHLASSHYNSHTNTQAPLKQYFSLARKAHFTSCTLTTFEKIPFRHTLVPINLLASASAHKPLTLSQTPK